jgi:hypothetical protein
MQPEYSRAPSGSGPFVRLAMATESRSPRADSERTQEQATPVLLRFGFGQTPFRAAFLAEIRPLAQQRLTRITRIVISANFSEAMKRSRSLYRIKSVSDLACVPRLRGLVVFLAFRVVADAEGQGRGGDPGDRSIECSLACANDPSVPSLPCLDPELHMRQA